MQSKQLEVEFDYFMNSIQFTRVSRDVGESPNFKNADYVNVDIQTVVELKVIEKDYFENGGIIDSLHSFLPKPIEVNEEGTGLYELRLPEKNREGKHDNFEEPLRRVLKNANRQLRDTRQYYFGENYSNGYVIIVISKTSLIDTFTTARVVNSTLSD
ncbi:MAG: hypothetical protein SFV55_05745 [Haliscomenobacter sp.]|uniref:hypothetical protein n=1 Tax=Haliscomenobacter sp. TaxID=2717303 RepID=UPI0029B664CA|nr:hypothetical protein [Haliscomenobacter sp.]MDX2067907.1 hypothetical protein [Haliscomenobacter sp.]